MRPHFHLSLLFSFFVFFLSCKPSFRNESDIQKYINAPDHRLTSTDSIGGISATLTWQPWQVLARKMNTKAVDTVSANNSYRKNSYFILSLSKDGQELLRQLDFNLYSKMISVLSFQMPQYIEATTDMSSSIPLTECLFQQTYGASNANRMLLVFNKADLLEAKKLTISVKEFGLGIGQIKFDIDPENMMVMESLNYDKIKF